VPCPSNAYLHQTLTRDGDTTAAALGVGLHSTKGLDDSSMYNKLPDSDKLYLIISTVLQVTEGQ
jgi:hypothetical protein